MFTSLLLFAIIDPSKVKSATNYYSSRDYLLILLQQVAHPVDTIRFMQLIPSQTNSGWMDHSLMHTTYRKKWIESLSELQIR